jgi:hypothetical protein
VLAAVTAWDAFHAEKNFAPRGLLLSPIETFCRVQARDSALLDSGLRRHSAASGPLDYRRFAPRPSLAQDEGHVYSLTIRTGLFPSLQVEHDSRRVVGAG